MEFGILGSFVQFRHGAEGNTLRQLGLIDVRERDYEAEAHPTPTLRAMFSSQFDLPTVYPLLVELVLCYKPSANLMVDQYRVEQRLKHAGMTEDGLETLRDLLGDRELDG